MEPRELVHVYTVREPTQAEIIKNALNGEGIQAAIENENQAGLAGILAIRILVPAEDYDRAARIIESHQPEEREQ